MYINNLADRAGATVAGLFHSFSTASPQLFHRISTGFPQHLLEFSTAHSSCNVRVRMRLRVTRGQSNARAGAHVPATLSRGGVLPGVGDISSLLHVTGTNAAASDKKHLCHLTASCK